MRRRFIVGLTKETPVVSKPAPTQAAPKKEVKKRTPRLNRVLNYRGITFFLVTRENFTTISTMDEKGHPQAQVEVEREKAIKACRALARLIKTEQELGAISKNVDLTKNNE